MYMFLGSEDDEDRVPPIVAMIARGTRVKSSRVAPRKGAVPKIVGLTAEDVRSRGIRRSVFKSDQEPSILALKARIIIIEALGSDFEIVPETSAVGEHESNGTVERAIRAIGNTVRTLATEQSCNVELGSACPALPWLAQHAGTILSRFEVGADGRTPYQRLNGKECKAKLPSFGEQVFYRPLRPSGARLNKLDAKYQEVRS